MKLHLKKSYKLRVVQRGRGEFTSNDFLQQLALEEVESNLRAPYTLQEDGVAEMSNRIIINNANAMMRTVNCSKLFRVKKMETTVYIRNGTTSKAIAMASTNDEGTSYEF